MNERELLHGLSEAHRREAEAIAELERLEAENAIDPAFVDATADRALAELTRQRKAPRRRIGRYVAGAAALAAAAAIALAIRSREEALPEYQATVVAGGASPERALGDVPKELAVRPGSQVDLLVRPATRVPRKIEARAFIAHDGALAPWDAAIEIADTGALRLRGRIAAIDGAGAWALVIVVAEAGAFPSQDPLVVSDHVRVVRVPLTLAPP
jgi:hypothetical protein